LYLFFHDNASTVLSLIVSKAGRLPLFPLQPIPEPLEAFARDAKGLQASIAVPGVSAEAFVPFSLEPHGKVVIVDNDP
jgi:hypothetical protein